MTTIIATLVDPHFSDKKPSSRKDNYVETQLRKFRDVLSLARSIRWDDVIQQMSAICIAGDIFHQQRGDLISRRLDNRLIEMFIDAPCPVLGILGNHDKDHDRDDSIFNHPVGTLVAARLLTLVHWPTYALVGSKPPVIVTGRQYTLEGPAAWLDMISSTGAIRKLKEELAAKHGCYVPCLLLTHCNWGQTDGALRGDPVVGQHHLLNTGADACVLGHPHTDDGVVSIPEGDKVIYLVGPGAFTRGTLAEHDINRKPKICIAAFDCDKPLQIFNIEIPHEPPEKVFDLVAHHRVRQVRAAEEKFIKAFAQLSDKAQTPEEGFASVSATTPERVVSRARGYYRVAEARLS